MEVHTKQAVEWRLNVHFLATNLMFFAEKISWFSGDKVVNCTTQSFHFMALINIRSMAPYALLSISSPPLNKQGVGL